MQSNRRRVQHRKHPSDTFAWAASAVLTEFPPGSLPGVAAAAGQPGQLPAHGPSSGAEPLPGGPTTSDAAALAPGPGGLGGSILPDDPFLLELLWDVDEDLDIDNVVDGVVDTAEDLQQVLEPQLAASDAPRELLSAGAAPASAAFPAHPAGPQQAPSSHLGLPGHSLSVVTTSAPGPAGLDFSGTFEMARQQQHQQQAMQAAASGAARPAPRRSGRRGSGEPAPPPAADEPQQQQAADVGMDSGPSSPVSAGAGKVSQRSRKSGGSSSAAAAAAASGGAAAATGKRGASASAAAAAAGSGSAGSGPDDGNGSGSFALQLPPGITATGATGGGRSGRHRRTPSDPSTLQLSAPALPGVAPLPLPLVAEKPLSEFVGQTRANALDPAQLDPKRARRIIANRQSAHRSRMKKLQLIHELEQRVSSARAATDSVRQQNVAAAERRRELLVAAAAAQQQLADLRREAAAVAAMHSALAAELTKLGITPPPPPSALATGADSAMCEGTGGGGAEEAAAAAVAAPTASEAAAAAAAAAAATALQRRVSANGGGGGGGMPTVSGGSVTSAAIGLAAGAGARPGTAGVAESPFLLPRLPAPHVVPTAATAAAVAGAGSGTGAGHSFSHGHSHSSGGAGLGVMPLLAAPGGTASYTFGQPPPQSHLGNHHPAAAAGPSHSRQPSASSLGGGPAAAPLSSSGLAAAAEVAMTAAVSDPVTVKPEPEAAHGAPGGGAAVASGAVDGLAQGVSPMALDGFGLGLGLGVAAGTVITTAAGGAGGGGGGAGDIDGVDMTGVGVVGDSDTDVGDFLLMGMGDDAHDDHAGHDAGL